MRFTIFKTGKPRQFKYVPRFYNPTKEALDERRRKIENELGVSKDEIYHHSLMRGSMSRKLSARRKANRNSLMRFLIIVAILLFLVFYFLNK